MAAIALDGPSLLINKLVRLITPASPILAFSMTFAFRSTCRRQARHLVDVASADYAAQRAKFKTQFTLFEVTQRRN
jgi:hypothetical protein